MTVRIDRTRMAMNGRCYAYDGVVPVQDAPQVPRHAVITQVIDGKHYFSFHDATMPAEHWQMELGWERYQAYLAHEKAAKVVLLGLAKSLYPELAIATKWPELWCEIPSLDASHAVRTMEVTQ